MTDGQPGVGRTRLLLELATQMLRDGHIPIIVASDDPGWQPPQSLQAFGERLRFAISEARRALHLGSGPEGQLAMLLGDRSARGRGQPSLRREIQAEIRPGGELTAVALRLAMQADLSRLVKDARKRHESVRRAEGRAVILLDLVEKYEKLLPEVIYQMLDGSGFGTSDEPVPAVLALAMGQPTTTVVKDALERIASRSWLYQLQLKPFDSETDEDLLAYSWILLNPPPSVFTDRHVLNDRANADVVGMARLMMQEMFGGLPRQFADPTRLKGFTVGALRGKFVLPLTSDEEDRKTLEQIRIDPGGLR